MQKKSRLLRTMASLIMMSSTPILASEGGRFFGSVDYLYWGFEQQGMPYGVILDKAPAQGAFPGNGSELQQKFEWGSGFRLGLGGAVPCTCIDASVYWTRFHNTASGSHADPIIVATELLGFTDIFIGGSGYGGPASASWKLEFDMIDFHIGSWICRPCGFAIHPYLGVKGGWIRQTQRIVYENFSAVNQPNPTLTARLKEMNRFSGVGPKLGFNSEYDLPCGLSLVGEMASSLLYGQLNSPSAFELLVSNGERLSGGFDYTIRRIIPCLQMLIGLNWETSLCDCYGLLIGVAYEAQYFWDAWRHQNSTIQNIYITDAGHGALMFQGLTVRFALGF